MITIEYPFKKRILASGAPNQASFCLTKKNCAFVFNDLGSLAEDSSLKHYQSEIEQSLETLKIKPQVIAHDLHLECEATKYVQQLFSKIANTQFVTVQHHQAHIASCMAENKIEEAAISVVLDSAGLGDDGKIWGGEFFVGRLNEWSRLAHFKYVPLLNGNSAVVHPWLHLASYLFQALGDNFYDLEIDSIRRHKPDNWQQGWGNITPHLASSSTAGLFDAVSLLLGLRNKIYQQGQGVVDLERIVNRSSHVAGKIYNFTIEQQQDKFLIGTAPILQDIVADLKKDTSKSIISAVFHNTIIEIVNRTCQKIKKKTKIKDVILTGSVFQNKILLNRIKEILLRDNFRVITHRLFACNDSNISFGQAVIANLKVKRI